MFLSDYFWNIINNLRDYFWESISENCFWESIPERLFLRDCFWDIISERLFLFSEGGEAGAGFDSIEQHFSDWSENDSDDDILNQPELVRTW